MLSEKSRVKNTYIPFWDGSIWLFTNTLCPIENALVSVIVSIELYAGEYNIPIADVSLLIPSKYNKFSEQSGLSYVEAVAKSTLGLIFKPFAIWST